VNCPVSLDIATGIYGKSADEFQKLKNRLKQSQSTKTTNQADPSHGMYYFRCTIILIHLL